MDRIALVLATALLAAACGPGRQATVPSAVAGTPDAAARSAVEGDHVAAVTPLCRYVTLEEGSQVTREGEGAVCRAAAPQQVGSVAVLRVFDLRVRLTIRSPSREAYTVETRDTDVRVGDPWPPPGR